MDARNQILGAYSAKPLAVVQGQHSDPSCEEILNDEIVHEVIKVVRVEECRGCCGQKGFGYEARLEG